MSKLQRAASERMGFSDDQIEEVEEKRREEWEALKARVYEASDLTEEEIENYYSDRYGFEHECHCLADKFADRMVETTICELEVKAKSLEALEEANLTISALREQLEAAGLEPAA